MEELIKGPVEQSEGLYSVIPQGTKLLETNLLDGDEEDSKVVALIFQRKSNLLLKVMKFLGG